MNQSPPIPIRVVIDTSVLLPILRRNNPATSPLVLAWQQGLISPLTNTETLQELRNKLLEVSPTPKPLQAQRFVEIKLKYYLPRSEQLQMQQLLNTPRCRDPNDQKFVDLATYSNADHLITRDADLLSMQGQINSTVMQEFQFLTILNRQRA